MIAESTSRRRNSATPVQNRFGRLRGRLRSAAQKIGRTRLGRLACTPGVARALLGTAIFTAALFSAGFYHVYLDRSDLPDLEGFTRFEFPAIGHIYDVNGQPLKEMATESREISRYAEIPPIVRDAILAAEDKNFFLHSGIDYSAFARVIYKVRLGDLLNRLTSMGKRNAADNSAIFPQGGSTITQQLVRGYFLKTMTARENSDQLRSGQRLARMLSGMVGARTVNMMVRKVEEIRLSLWVEERMRDHFGSKRLAKEEILARYASLVYMGNGQYGFARGAEYYFGQPLGELTAVDADKAALLAGIAKSARFYAPGAADAGRVLRRRDQTLALMAARGFITPGQERTARQRPIEVAAQHRIRPTGASAVVDTVIDELANGPNGFRLDDLRLGRIQIYSTVDAGVQKIANEALERGLLVYEKRRPGGRGLIQGSVVVLRNRDASIVAEAGGRQFYKDRPSAYTDFNRATKSLRQPGSAMKPFVYLAAFRQGSFDLDSVVPDEPIAVVNGEDGDAKWISNYDGQFKGMIPLRMALAESRNAVAVWMTQQIGVESVLRTARSLGIQTPLRPYPTTALGASEVTLLELANAYRTIASGIQAKPYVIRTIVRDSGEVLAGGGQPASPVQMASAALSLIQEGLRGVVRMPTGTGHALDSLGFPIAVMGKTGTTNEFRDALFVGSTYGPEGITVAVRIGFDDNRTLGSLETGGRVALPVFKEIVLRAYSEKLVGPVPQFPTSMEQRISHSMTSGEVDAHELTAITVSPIKQ